MNESRLDCYSILSIVNDHLKEYLKALSDGRKTPDAEKVLQSKVSQSVISNYKSERNCYSSKLETARKYSEVLVDSLKRFGLNPIVVDAVLDESSRLLIGSSTGVLTTVFEIGMSWDHLLDLPYIPASSLKGASKNALRPLVSARLLSRLLGDDDKKLPGCVMFFDGYPIEAPNGLLDADIITPHYYKGGEVVETEIDVKPSPILHLSVPPGVKFRIVLGHICGRGDLEELANQLGLGAGMRIEASLVVLLGIALSEGLGSRVSKGYGFFRITRVEFS